MAEFEVFRSHDTEGSLQPCNVCGRTFMPDSLAKHQKICAKNSTKVRKVFQSGKQRAEGSDVPVNKILKSGSPVKIEKPSNNSWKQKHEDFISTIRAARGVQKALSQGGPLPPPPPPTINPDYVQCPTCNRRFNATAAERHMPFCAERNKRLPDKKTIAPEAHRRNQARLNYKTANFKRKAKPDSQIGFEDGYYSSVNSRTGSADSISVKKPTAIPRPGGFSAGDTHGRKAYTFRTGRTEENYNAGLRMRNNSLERQRSQVSNALHKHDQDTASRFQSSQANSSVNSRNGYIPSPPNGRPPSGAYQHRSRESSGDERRRNKTVSKFCSDCGFKFCRADANFCCECGMKRVCL